MTFEVFFFKLFKRKSKICFNKRSIFISRNLTMFTQGYYVLMASVTALKEAANVKFSIKKNNNNKTARSTTSFFILTLTFKFPV